MIKEIGRVSVETKGSGMPKFPDNPVTLPKRQ